MRRAREISSKGIEDSLNFSWLYQRVQQCLVEDRRSKPSRIERWSFWIALGMTGVGLGISGLSPWLPPVVTISVTTACLVGELVGLSISLGLTLKREVPQFVRPRELHAIEMDADYRKWHDLVAELQQYPRRQREWRLSFVRQLRDHMNERLGLAFGGIQRLGVLPLLVALYLQFRNWKWGDWTSAFDVNLLAGLIVWAMLLLYSGGWLLVGLRIRLDSYVSLLEESLKREVEERA